MRYIAVVLGLVALNACSNVGGSLTPPAKGAGVPAATSLYNWYSIKPSSCGLVTTSAKCDAEVTGINDSRDIVGNEITDADLSLDNCSTTIPVRKDTTSDADSCDCPIPSGAGMPVGYYWYGYTSEYSSGYTSLKQAMYPYYRSSEYLSAISNRTTSAKANSTVEVGCVVNNIDGQTTGGAEVRATQAAVDNGGLELPGLWNVLPKAAGSNNQCKEGSVGVLLSIDDHSNAVGYYDDYPGGTDVPCSLKPYVVKPGDQKTHISVTFNGAYCGFKTSSPFTSYGASGISSDGKFIVGFGRTSSSTYAWYAPYSTSIANATVLCYNGDKNEPTAFTGVRDVGGNPVMVGWFAEGTTSAAKTHGFQLTVTGSASAAHYTWTEIHAAGELGYEVVSGTNKYGDVCGWYKGADGLYHGFVGIYNTAPRTKARNNKVRPRT